MAWVTESLWRERMSNLLNIWRKSDRPSIMAASPAGDYKSHLSKVFLGKSVLDLGCGDESLQTLLPDGTKYVGVDPFPIKPTTFPCKAEELNIHADTIIAFAILDGCLDPVTTLERINACARENVVILTAIGIEPDQFHTHRIEEEMLIRGLKDFNLVFSEEVSPSIFLYDFRFRRNG